MYFVLGLFEALEFLEQCENFSDFSKSENIFSVSGGFSQGLITMVGEGDSFVLSTLSCLKTPVDFLNESKVETLLLSFLFSKIP